MAEHFLPKKTAPVEECKPVEQESEPVKVVRVFLFQSRTPDSIRDDEPLASISLTNMVLVQKGADAANPNQLMPVGGKILPGESPQDAARRETVEETHLRPPMRSLREASCQQRYSFAHGRSGQTERRIAHIFTAKLSGPAYDIPAVLDPEEDKIERFVYLSIPEAHQLFTEGHVTLADGQVYKVQDAFSPDARQREQFQTTVHDAEQRKIVSEVLDHQRTADARTKIILLRTMRQGHVNRALLSERAQAAFFDAPQYQTQLAESQLELLWADLTDPQVDHDAHYRYQTLIEFDRLWAEAAQHLTAQDIRVTLQYADFGGMINNAKSFERRPDGQHTPLYSETTGINVPSMTLLLPFLLNQELRPDYKPDPQKIRTLYRNPTMRRLLAAFTYARRFARDQPKPAASESSNQLIKELQDRGLLRRELVAHYDELASQLDSFFERLRDEADLTDNEAPIDQLEVIKGISLPELIRIAASTPEQIATDFPQAHDPTNPGADVSAIAKMLQWEAGRKLSLLTLLADAVVIRDRSIVHGIEPLQKIEADSKQHPLMKKYLSGMQEHSRPGDAPKTLLSLLRKLIVRDQTIGTDGAMAEICKDIFAKSYVFDGVETPDLLPSNFVIPTNPATGTQYSVRSNGKRLTSLNAPPVITDLLTAFLDTGGGQVSIVDFKSLPTNGGGIESAGPGGGADLRFAKLYLEHTNDTGMKQYREIQIYVPDPVNGRSGSEEYTRKKQDDHHYGIRRLFGTYGVRSFIELLYPAAIYNSPRPQISRMYSKRVS